MLPWRNCCWNSQPLGPAGLDPGKGLQDDLLAEGQTFFSCGFRLEADYLAFLFQSLSCLLQTMRVSFRLAADIDVPCVTERCTGCRAAEVVCRQGPAAVLELASIGANFTCTSDPAMLHLTREGGHTHRRVVHAADATGAEIERALLASASTHHNIRFFEHCTAVDLVVDEVSAFAAP